MQTAFIKTPLGTAKIVGDENGIAGISILEEGAVSKEIPVALVETVTQLQDYFNGKRNEFNIKINPSGTEFQRKVWNELLNISFGKTMSYLDLSKKLGDVNPKTVKEMYERIHSQSEVQTIIEGIDVMISKYRNELSESTVKNYDNNLRHNITSYNELKKKDHKLLDLNKNFELSQGNLQAFREGGIVFKTLISNWERQKVLNETGKGLPAPTQLKPSLRRAVVAENEMYVDTLAGLTRDESFVRTNLAKKRGSYKETYQQKKESLDRAQRMDVDLGEGQDGQTPNETPAKIKSMYEDLAKWLSDVVKNIRYEKDLLKRSFDRMINERDPNKALDPSAKMQIEKSLTEIQNDLKYFENEYGKYASTALIATEMARKQRFLQKIGPIQKKIAAMIKGGFSPVGLMFNYSQADAGGDSQSYGQLLYSILNEEKKALGILRNAYIEARQSTTPVDLSTYLGITGTNSTGEVEIR